MSKKNNSNFDSSTISFTYNNFDKNQIHEVNFQEKNFEEILKECFETSVEVHRVEVYFSKIEEINSHTVSNFKCRIHIIPLGQNVSHTGSDPAKTIREACHLAVKRVREVKNKLSTH